MIKLSKVYLLILVMMCSGCEAIDIIAGIGAGTSAAGVVVPHLLAGSRAVSPKAVLEKIDNAYQEYDKEVAGIMGSLILTPKERKSLIAEKTKVLKSRVKAYNGLLGNAYGFPQELINSLSTAEGQETMGELAKLLPPPFNELALGGTSLGLLVLTILGYGGRGRFKNTAVLLGNMIESLKKSGVLSKTQVVEAAKLETSNSKIDMAALTNFLKKYNIS